MKTTAIDSDREIRQDWFTHHTSYVVKVMSYLALFLFVGTLIIAATSCSPSLSDKDSAMMKGAGDNAATALKNVATLQVTVNAQAAQIAALQKQLAAASGNQTSFALKADVTALQNAVNALSAGGSWKDMQTRLATVEGQSAVLNANFGTYRKEVNAQLAGYKTTLDTLAAMFLGTSPALSQLEVLRLQMIEVQNRLAKAGW